MEEAVVNREESALGYSRNRDSIMRNLMNRVVVIALVVGGMGVRAVEAQDDARRELLIGAGYLWAHSAASFPAYDFGMALWLNGQWGIAGRYVQAVGDDPDGRVGPPRYSTLTARYRAFMGPGIDLTVGMGARVIGSRAVVWLDDREPWGEGLVLELLAGRPLFGHVGIRGGVTFQGDWQEDLLVLPAVFAVLSF